MEEKQLTDALTKIFVQDNAHIVFWNDPEREFEGYIPHSKLTAQSQGV